jgi:predicted enzyme related to lactoylglutathione lyase
MNLEQVRLIVKRFDECFKFHRDVMGFKVNWGEEGWSYASFDVGERINLALLKKESMAKALGTSTLPSDSASQDRVALVFDVEEVDAKIRRLRKRGVHDHRTKGLS